MAWYLILTRPRYEAAAARYIDKQLGAQVQYPTKPDPNNPNNTVPVITGYVLMHTLRVPCGSDQFKGCQSANPRYLMTYSHTIPGDLYRHGDDPGRFYTNPAHQIDIKERPFDVYVPHTLPDAVVDNLSSTLQTNQQQIISSIIGRKVKIPSGLCMGLRAKIKKITEDARRVGDPFCTLRICDERAGMLQGTKLVFPLSELGL